MSPLGMRPTDRSEFGTAIICALTLEADAIEALFDETYDKFGRVYGKQSGDTDLYITGRIGQHNIVLCYLPGIGIGSAASAAANLQVSYTRIHLALVVGICGAVPFPSPSTEIILGDIIISDSVIQYDFGRQYPDGFRQKSDVKEVLGRPSQEIRALLAALKGRRTRRELEAQIYEHLQFLAEEEDVWRHPGLVHDVLFEASYHHKHRQQRPGATCICFDPTPTFGMLCDEAVMKDCNTLGCKGNQITRRRCGINSTIKPCVHIGSLASANTVMKCGEHRDRIAEREGVIGFEMEGAGVWDSVPCIIIKGVCDYADSHKNKLWQDYAAATAASCAKAFLGYWTPRTTEGKLVHSSLDWHNSVFLPILTTY
ncbi:kinesin light chain [Penicillium malachiteum]|nr:kinesin light chain [Penicillium malachiteum]